MHRLVRVLFLCTLALVTADPALAQRPKAPVAAPIRPKPLAESLEGQARSEYLAARVLFDDGDFATALEKYKSVYGKASDPRLLWNLAACHKNLRRYARASVLLRQYVKEGGALLTSEDIKEAEELLKVIDELTVPVTITVSEPDAEVFLEDEAIGRSPFKATVLVDLGQRRFRVQKAGFRPIVSTHQIGPIKEVTFKLEPQRAGLELTIPPTARATLDGQPLGQGPRIVTGEVPVGPHTLRIEAPQMRPYQGEVVLEDGKTRTLAIDLERDLTQFGEVRVAVGCADPRIRTPDDGLVVFIDDSTDSASPLGVRMRIEGGREVPAYVPFTVTSGAHRVRVRLTGCEELSIAVTPTAAQPSVVTGMLPPTNPWFNATPAGTPDGLRVSAGLSTGTIEFAKFDQLFSALSTAERTSAGLALAGPSVSGGFVWRWFTALLDLRYLVGSSAGGVGVAYDGAAPVARPLEASFSTADLGLRGGLRVPIHSATFGLGVGASTGLFTIDAATEKTTHSYTRPFGWASLEAKPLCDFGVGVAFSGGAAVMDFDEGSRAARAAPGLDTSTLFHVTYEPNVLCRNTRAGRYRLEAAAAASPAAAAPTSPPGTNLTASPPTPAQTGEAR